MLARVDEGWGLYSPGDDVELNTVLCYLEP